MDAFELLRKDHERIRDLFSDVMRSSGAGADERYGALKEALEIHTQIEEDVLYPALENPASTHDIVEDSLREHAEAKRQLSRIDSMPSGSDAWFDGIRTLEALIESHVEKEERELFPRARDTLPGDEQDDMEARLFSEQQTLGVLHHPGKPGPMHRY